MKITLTEAYKQAVERPLSVVPGYVNGIAKIKTTDRHTFIEMSSVNCALLATAFNELPNAIELLQRLEWSVWSACYLCCPICGNAQKYGHGEGCELNRILSQTKEIEVPNVI